MPGHQHFGDPALTQNQGNVLGDRPCVRQSRLYREHVGGNAMKDLMGKGGLKWDTTHTEGAYAGGTAFDHNSLQNPKGSPTTVESNRQQPVQQEVQQPQQKGQEEVVIAIDAVDEDQTKSSAQQRQEPQAQKEEQASPIAGRMFRPGAGHANRQTYNIFTGE